MRILFTAVNAKYIHSNLAIRYLKKYNEKKALCDILEFTINGTEENALKEIYLKNPDAVFFSCYLWNIDFILSVSDALKKINPEIKIVLGGPEVSFDAEKLMEENPFIDFITIGEGEISSSKLIDYMKGEISIKKVPSLFYRDSKGISFTEKCPPMKMDDVPFPYDDLSGLEHKIIYYETQRGCPFSCKYCLSSLEKGVRFLSEERIVSDLNFFLKEEVPLVKFVDRTFNCNPKHSRFIWKYLIENDNGKSCFHMEIKGELLSEEDFELLSKARAGLFRFEIGVQTGNEDVLYEISRRNKKDLLYKNAMHISEMGNIHTHLDLIAGLPGEDFSSFRDSFNEVYSLNPHELQLGFLKLLKGSKLREDAEKLGISYRKKAPYEVLFTKEISYEKLLRLKDLEACLEIFYNSGKASKTFKYCGKFFETPFDMYDKLGKYWREKGFDSINLTKDSTYEAALKFFENAEETKEKADIIKDLLYFDYLMQSRSYKTPKWAEKENTEEILEKKSFILKNKELFEKDVPFLKDIRHKDVQKLCRAEKFDCDVLSADPNKDEKWVIIYYGEEIKAEYILF